MSLMTKIQEALAANPGVSWNDLVLRRLRTATSSTDGALNDLWMRWLASQGYTQGSLNDRMAAYWSANNTPPLERSAFYLGYLAFFSVPPVTVVITDRSNNFPTASQTWSGFRFERAGTIIPDSNVGTGTRITNQWVSVGQSATVGDGFEIRATLNAGTANGTTAAFGVWLPLTSDVTFALTTGGNFTAEIRPVAGAVVGTATYTVNPV